MWKFTPTSQDFWKLQKCFVSYSLFLLNNYKLNIVSPIVIRENNFRRENGKVFKFEGTLGSKSVLCPAVIKKNGLMR